MGYLSGKVALVTGAGCGLGAACAHIFAREGAKVVIADLNPEDGEATAKAIRDSGGEAIFVAADVGKSTDVQRMVKTAVDSFGGLDCAVNNAVCNIGRNPLADIEQADWERAHGQRREPRLHPHRNVRAHADDDGRCAELARRPRSARGAVHGVRPASRFVHALRSAAGYRHIGDVHRQRYRISSMARITGSMAARCNR